MTLELIAATDGDIPVLRRLMQFYLYDIAALDLWDLREDGTYGNPQRIETFWNAEEYNRFLIRVDGVLAGFVLTSETASGESQPVHVLNEFFVLRRYRRTGIGREIARRVFGESKGIWQLSVMRNNAPALEFWAEVIRSLTGKERHEFTASEDADEDVVFRFTIAETT